MSPSKFLRFCLFAFLLSLLPLSALAEPVRVGHARAELVTDVRTVTPGTKFYAALHLVLDDNWHTYWRSSTTGFPPSIGWKLPEGVKAGTLRHPVPGIYLDGGIVDYIHDGDVLMPVEITVSHDFKPANGRLVLKADASWLACSDICVPANATFVLSLPVTDAAPEPDAAWAAKIKAVVDSVAEPVSGGRWSFDVTQKDRKVIIDAKSDGSHDPGRLYFYSADGNLAAAAIEQQSILPDGTIRVVLPLSQYAPDNLPELRGLMTAAQGWGDGQPKGFKLVVPFEAGAGIAASAEPPPGVTVSLLSALGLALLGGLILNLMPCVFPVLGLKVMSFVKLAGKKGGRAWADATAFACGVLMTLTALAILLFALRSAGAKIGWGFQLQDPRVLFVGGIVFLLFAMNMAGAYEIGLSACGIGAAREKKTKGEFAASFFSGVLAVVVATPCSAPFLGTAVGFAFARPAWELLAVFWAVGIGFSLPYVILAAFPKLLGFLPKPGAWMESLRHFLSLFLLATVAYLAWTLKPFIGGDFTYFKLALAALFTVLAALLYGKYSDISEGGARPSPTFAKVKKKKTWPRAVKRYAVPGLLLAGALAVGWPGSAKARDDGSVSRTPVNAFEEGDETPHFTEWRPGLAEKLSAEGRIVWVDFTARWCATCQVNKAVIFASPEVRDAFRKHKVVALKADWTGQDETITRELAKWNRYAVPFNLVYAPGKKPVEMPTLLTPGAVSKALDDDAK